MLIGGEVWLGDQNFSYVNYGTFNIPVPLGCYSLTINSYGGGGGGGGDVVGHTDAWNGACAGANAAGGGSSGGHVSQIIPVIPGTTVTVIVGKGGDGGASVGTGYAGSGNVYGGNGSVGGQSYVTYNSTNYAIAAGGNGGGGAGNYRGNTPVFNGYGGTAPVGGVAGNNASASGGINWDGQILGTPGTGGSAIYGSGGSGATSTFYNWGDGRNACSSSPSGANGSSGAVLLAFTH